MRRPAALLLACSLFGPGPASAVGKENDPVRIYVGTYTKEESEGINLIEMDPETGAISLRGVVAATENPSFLAIHPDRPLLFAVNEVGQYEGDPSGSVTTYAIDPETGKLSPINRQSSRGAAPCHIVVDAAGKNALVANYSGGNVAVLPIASDGSLGEASDVEQHRGSSVNPRRQEGPHAHSINLDASGRFAVAADLGLDKLLVYRFDPDAGTLTPNDPPSASVRPGAGPRHFAFHPSNRLAFSINEIDSTVTAFRFDPEAGTLEETQTLSTLPADFEGTSYTADVHVHPNGRFLYGSNRGHDSIAVFEIDEQAGTLEPRSHHPTGGATPRNFTLDPSGRFLLAANQGSDSIIVFRIDPETGALEQTDHKVEVPSPVCLMFVPSGE